MRRALGFRAPDFFFPKIASYPAANLVDSDNPTRTMLTTESLVKYLEAKGVPPLVQDAKTEGTQASVITMWSEWEGGRRLGCGQPNQIAIDMPAARARW